MARHPKARQVTYTSEQLRGDFQYSTYEQLRVPIDVGVKLGIIGDCWVSDTQTINLTEHQGRWLPTMNTTEVDGGTAVSV
jgi:hypothetical protein